MNSVAVDVDDESSDEDVGEEVEFEETDQEQRTVFTYNPLPPAAALTPAERKLKLAALALEYGVPPQKDVNVRFVIGVSEINRPPGKRPRELDKFKRKWRELGEFSRKVNWRRIMANGFDGDRMHPSQTFLIDGIEWTSVTHFLLGMLYRAYPEYSTRYSLQASKDEGGFWGSVSGAEREHANNIRFGAYEPDPNFDQNVEAFLSQALLAKFTQNPLAKRALLLTEDAVISVRGGPEGILDIPVFSQVRSYIKANPKAIFKGPNRPIEQEEVAVPTLSNVEMLNYGYIAPEQTAGQMFPKVAGSVANTSLYPSGQIQLYRETEDIESSECIIYLHTGSLALDIQKLSSTYGAPRYVRRPVYALEHMADDGKRIFIGVQRTPTIFKRNYLVFSLALEGGQFNLYLEPFTNGFGVSVIAPQKDQQVLDFMNYLAQGSSFSLPTGVAATAVEVPLIVPFGKGAVRQDLQRRFVPFGDLNRIYHRVKVIWGLETDQLFTNVEQSALYNVLNAIERLLVGLADLNGEDLFAENPGSVFMFEKLKNEVAAVKTIVNGDQILTHLRDRMSTADLNSSTALELQIQEDPVWLGDQIHYRDYNVLSVSEQNFRFYVNLAIASQDGQNVAAVERERWALRAVTRMYMSYQMLLSRGQQWSLNSNVAACLNKEFNIHLEAFASPLNSNLIANKVPFGSVFDEVDRPFGSVGNVFRLDLVQFLAGRTELNVLVNPPFTEQILGDLCLMLEKWFELCAPPPRGLGVKLTIFMITPLWEDSFHVQWLQKYPLVAFNHSLQKGTYSYSNLNTRSNIKAMFSSVFSIVTNQPGGLDNSKVQRCLHLF